MSESKSDALTNLATPLHQVEGLRLQPRTVARGPPSPLPPSLAIFSATVSASPSANSQRMCRQAAAPFCLSIPPAEPSACVRSAAHRCRLVQNRTARARHPAVAENPLQERRRSRDLRHRGFCRNLQIVLAKGQSVKPRRAKPSTIAASTLRPSKLLWKSARVSMPAAGLTATSQCGASAIG